MMFESLRSLSVTSVTCPHEYCGSLDCDGTEEAGSALGANMNGVR